MSLKVCSVLGNFSLDLENDLCSFSPLFHYLLFFVALECVFKNAIDIVHQFTNVFVVIRFMLFLGHISSRYDLVLLISLTINTIFYVFIFFSDGPHLELNQSRSSLIDR